MRTHRRWLLRGVTVVFIGVASYFIAVRVRANWDEIARFQFTVQPIWLGCSLVILCLAFLWFAFGWEQILRRMRYRFSLLAVLHIWYKAQLGKYVPGFLWHVVGRAHWGRAIGLPWPVAVSSTVLEAILMIIGAAVVSSTVLPVYIQISWFGDITRYVFLLPIALIFFLHPAVLNRGLRLVHPSAEGLDLCYSDILYLLAVYVMRWVLAGTAFILLVQAVYPLPLGEWPFLAASFALAWAVGFITVFAPGGIGVREVVLVALLETVMPTATAVIVALLSRLWWIAAELTMFTASMALTFAFGRREQPHLREADHRQESQSRNLPFPIK
ncbi:YbhN family protein [Acidobacteria bacterium AH-259-A15]|nr:YbhN family protein [Acidobacteria bacterium AH-259-A15]